MLRLLVLTCVLALGVSEPEAEPAPAASRLFGHRNEHDHELDHERLNHGRGHNGGHRHNHDEGHRRDHNNEHLAARQSHIADDVMKKKLKIIEEVYSPDYYEPTLILDYRYLKSGGRDYIRGPGGQVIILPHGVHSHEHKDHKDYDSLIEFLRLRHLAHTEASKQRAEDMAHHHHSHAGHRGHGHEEQRHGHEGRWL